VKVKITKVKNRKKYKIGNMVILSSKKTEKMIEKILRKF